MLNSSLGHSLLQDFVSSYQRIQTSEIPYIPFVFVDTDGQVRLLTNVVGDDGSDDGVFALSMAKDGWMEFLTWQE